MHSHNRTLLASLGFADPDKKESRHDLACRYLAQKETALKVFGKIMPEQSRPFDSKKPTEEKAGERKRLAIEVVGEPEFEVAISKGDGQYKTTIGFIDLILPFTIVTRDAYRERFRSVADYDFMVRDEDKKYTAWSEWIEKEMDMKDEGRLFVEIKIQPVGAAEILRQINLYREHLQKHPRFFWLVVTAWRPSDGEIQQLWQSKCFHVLLAEKFDDYCASQHEQRSRGTTEVFEA